MSKIIYVKKAGVEKPIRNCKNCGKDISNKKKGAQFCCRECWLGYTTQGKLRSRYYN